MRCTNLFSPWPWRMKGMMLTTTHNLRPATAAGRLGRTVGMFNVAPGHVEPIKTAAPLPQLLGMIAHTRGKLQFLPPI